MNLIATCLMILIAVNGVHAQTVFRCGSVYSQTPCPQGRFVEATDPRSASQRDEAERIAAAERKLAADMRNDRINEENARRPATAGSLSTPRPAAAAEPDAAKRKQKQKQKRSSVKHAASGDFVASGPRAKKKRAVK